MSNTSTQNRKDQLSGSGATGRQLPLSNTTAPVPDHLSQNISAIKALHERAEQDVSQHQRVVEAVAAFFGRPAFLHSILLAISLWVLPNLLPRRFSVPHFDPPPFDWLERTITLSSLLVTTGVLIKQSRQEKLAERRAHLSLQMNLLAEQKTAKLIALVEELRRDLPGVRNRKDLEAEVMKQFADPQAVMKALEEAPIEELEALQKQNR
ncbi:MAG: DUF1003 domain-containing protein [Chroococcidiopsidaceae cyanobacterium CP_BM_RX_35]|nr:DUF1003 domain-containing protein [Chroococcidiopsidaceae cyanobacterium CP_BM_RX_35]